MRPERVRRALFSFTGLFAFVIATGAAVPTRLAAAAEPHPFTVHDLLAMQRISDPQVSPDGTRVLFTLRTTDLEGNAGRNDLWLVGTDGSGLRQITTHKSGDFNGRWSPGRPLDLLPFDALRLVAGLPAGARRRRGGAGDRPAGRRLEPRDLARRQAPRLQLEVFPACGADLDCTKKRLDENEARKASGKIYDSLFIRHWDTWADGRRNHLFVMPTAGGAAVDLMPGFDADAPSKPFGGSEEYTFTPDGKGVVYSARNVGREEAWSTNFDLFYSPLDGKTAPRKLTTNPAWDTQPGLLARRQAAGLHEDGAARLRGRPLRAGGARRDWTAPIGS